MELADSVLVLAVIIHTLHVIIKLAFSASYTSCARMLCYSPGSVLQTANIML